MRRPKSLLAVATLLATAPWLAASARADEAPGSAHAWEPVSSKDGIVVQRRAVDGISLKEFQGRGVIQAPIGRVLGVIRDGTRRTEWMPNCTSSYVVEENIAARTQLAYHRTKAPWPVADRDSVNRAEMRVEPARHRVLITFEAVPVASVPPVKGVVRMPLLRGHWILKPVDGGRATDVEYQVLANPGGSLPDWLCNLVSKTLPRETIAGLRRQVTRASYPELEAQVASAPETKEMLGTN